MNLRRLALVCGLGVIVLAVGAYVAVDLYAPPELQWRLRVVSAKARGDLSEIPLRNLIGWLAPHSPVYLGGVAENPNLHLSVKNVLISREDAAQGKILYLRQCGSCHGEAGRGDTGPNLLNAVSSKSDWSFFSTAKWGRTGTSMQAQPMSDAEIWQVHAYLRNEELGALRQPSARTVAARPVVDVEMRQIVETDKSPGQWLTYAGNYSGHRHSLFAQVTKSNVRSLRLAWTSQLRQIDRELEVSPIVANGVMFVTESRDGVVALDAKTGETIWKYRRPVPDGLPLCCGMPNRGAAVLGQTVFVATIDSYLVALDANTGNQRWIVKVADYHDGYSMTGAPLALGDRVVVGVAGGEFGARGFLAAYDLAEGKLLWKFYTVPGPGEPGHETWAGNGNAWKTGGAPTWTTGAYDAKEDLIFWGTGNPSPEFQANVRPGDNLFSNSVLAIEAKTGRLRWFYQFTPSDEHDWDGNQQPILTDIEWQGRKRAVLLQANRNAFFYALDRKTGEFLFAKPFVKQTWNEGFDAKGRPRIASSARPSASGTVVWPALTAATNWWPPSYDQQRQLVFVPCSDAAGVYFQSEKVKYNRGERFEGSAASLYAQNQPATAFVKAIDARSGEVRWETVLEKGSDNFIWAVGGVLSTKSGVVFAGYRDYFRAFDADTGKELWKVNLGARVRASPISFLAEGTQYVAVAAGHSMFAFRLPGP